MGLFGLEQIHPERHRLLRERSSVFERDNPYLLIICERTFHAPHSRHFFYFFLLFFVVSFHPLEGEIINWRSWAREHQEQQTTGSSGGNYLPSASTSGGLGRHSKSRELKRNYWTNLEMVYDFFAGIRAPVPPPPGPDICNNTQLVGGSASTSTRLLLR